MKNAENHEGLTDCSKQKCRGHSSGLQFETTCFSGLSDCDSDMERKCGIACLGTVRLRQRGSSLEHNLEHIQNF